MIGVLVRWCLFSGVLLLVGVVAWRGGVVPRFRALLVEGNPSRTPRFEVEDPRVALLERRMAGAGAILAGLLLPVWTGRLGVQLQDFRDPFVPLREDLAFLLGETTWGSIWIVQGLLLGVLVPLFLVLRHRAGRTPPPEPGLTPEGIPRDAPPAVELPLRWKFAAAGILALALTLALSSHAMSVPGIRPLAVAVDLGHLVAGGTWVGVLALILLLTPSRRSPPGLLAPQLLAFSPMAMVSVGVLVFLGLVLAGLHVHEWPVLWEEPYGRILSLKILAALGVMAMGLWNWRRSLPRLREGSGERAVTSAIALEVALAAGVVLLTAILVATPLPPGAH